MATTKKLAKKSQPVTAFEMHGDDGVNVIGVGNLRVMIYPEGDNVWIAQGLEMDYTAEGTSVEDVQRRFEEGLSASLHANIRVFNHIGNFLRPAPPAVWQRLIQGSGCSKHRFSLVSAAKTILDPDMPFAGIDYYVPAELLAAS